MTRSTSLVTLLSTIAITVLSLQAQAEDLFPDKNLEAAVRRQVFEKRNSKDPLVEKDVVNISTIDGRGKGIQNLKGLEACKSLAAVDLADNQIQDDLQRSSMADATPIRTHGYAIDFPSKPPIAHSPAQFPKSMP